MAYKPSTIPEAPDAAFGKLALAIWQRSGRASPIMIAWCSMDYPAYGAPSDAHTECARKVHATGLAASIAPFSMCASAGSAMLPWAHRTLGSLYNCGDAADGRWEAARPSVHSHTETVQPPCSLSHFLLPMAAMMHSEKQQ